MSGATVLPRRPRVFISYGRRDGLSFARRLSGWLRDHGYEPWLDVENGIPVGAAFDARIESGLAASDMLVAVLTEASVRPDGFCRNELLFAQARQIPIVPIRLQEVVPPIQIIASNFIDAVGAPETVFVSLTSVLDEALRHGRMPRQPWLEVDAQAPWWTTLRRWSPIEELRRYGEHFVGRDWLFDEMRWWVREPHSWLYLLTGDPGIGKSAVIAQATTRLDVRGVHFCSRANVDSCDASHWVAGLAYQLAALPRFRSMLERLQSPRWDHPESLFRTLIVEPLSELAQDVPPDEPWVFALDGLDEAETAMGTGLPELLAAIPQLGAIPPWIRFVVTSRPVERLLAMFRLEGVVHRHLSGTEDRNRADCSRYIASRLEEGAPGEGSAAERRELARRLSEAAGGNFLFAKVSLDVLGEAPTASWIAFESGGYPARLGGLYHAMFRRRFGDLALYDREVRPLLECLVAAREPLPKALLTSGAAVRPECDARAGLLTLSQFLVQREGGFALFHDSLREWLLDGGASAEFAISAEAGAVRLAGACWREYQRTAESVSPYAQRHLPRHLAEAGRWSELLAAVRGSNLGLMRRWTDGREADDGVVCLTGLIEHLRRVPREAGLAAGFATQLARIFAQRGRHADAEEWLRRALKWAPWWQARRARAIAHHELGSLRLYRRELRAATRAYRRALALCQWWPPRLHDEMAANLVGLATVALLEYSPARAARLAERALREAIRQADTPHIVAAQRLLATALRDQLQLDDAERHAADAFTLAERGDVALEYVAVTQLRGWLAYMRAVLAGEAPDEAAVYFARAATEADRTLYATHRVDARLALTWCALAQRKPGEAERHLDHAARLLLPDAAQHLIDTLVLGRAALAHQRGDSDAAAALYHDAIARCAQSTNRAREADAWVGLGAVRWHAGSLLDAEQCWERGRALARGCTPARLRLVELSIEGSRVDSSFTPR